MMSTINGTDYINRYAVLNVIDDAVANNALSYEDGINEILRFIAKIPAADVRPVVRGKWELVDDVLWLCSKCHYAHGRSNYCPNCGADMRE